MGSWSGELIALRSLPRLLQKATHGPARCTPGFCLALRACILFSNCSLFPSTSFVVSLAITCVMLYLIWETFNLLGSVVLLHEPHAPSTIIMLHGKNIHHLLELTLSPVQTVVAEHEPLFSSLLVSCTNGSIISYANSDTAPTTYNNSSNNLKMMALLVRDKWNEDQQDPSAQATHSCYQCEAEDGEVTRVYTYELEDLHACVAQIPRSDLLLLFIASSDYPYGLLVKKMKAALQAFSSMYGYKLN